MTRSTVTATTVGWVGDGLNVYNGFLYIFFFSPYFEILCFEPIIAFRLSPDAVVPRCHIISKSPILPGKALTISHHILDCLTKLEASSFVFELRFRLRVTTWIITTFHRAKARFLDHQFKLLPSVCLWSLTNLRVAEKKPTNQKITQALLAVEVKIIVGIWIAWLMLG